MAQRLLARSKDTHVAVISLFLDRISDDDALSRDFPNQSREEIVMRSILKQLVQAKIEKNLPSPTLNTLASSVTSSVDVSLDAAKELVHAEVEDLQEVYILVDALDQCPEEAQKKLQIEFTLFLREVPDLKIRLMMVQSAPGLPSAERASCNISECPSQSVILYWHCPHCHEGRYRVCNDCYAKDFRCLDRYVSRVPYGLGSKFLTIRLI